VRPNERAILKHTTTPGIGGLPSERALSLAAPGVEAAGAMAEANVRGRLRSRAGALALFLEEGARAALKMAVSRRLCGRRRFGAITLYQASRR
jgi:hypothetical protein